MKCPRCGCDMIHSESANGYYCYQCGFSLYLPVKTEMFIDNESEIEFLTEGARITYRKERK
jgi:tRNA(Ile2) C34 agmatinyltransferase TiaS